MADVPETYPKLFCDRHARLTYGYLVCIHILKDAPTAYHEAPTEDEMGLLMCAACIVLKPPLGVENFKLACGECAAKKGWLTISS